MKKYLSIIAVLLFCNSINALTLTVSGPSSLTTGSNGNYTAALVLGGDLTGYTLFWSINSAAATLTTQPSGVNCTLFSVSRGTVNISVIAFKDGVSPSYCATKTITIEDACANKYRINDTQCTVGTGVNGWKFQLVNSAGSAVNVPGIVWNSPSNPVNGLSYFVIDSASSGSVVGHPNPVNQPGAPDIYMQFSVTCTIGGCTYYYANYADGACNTGNTGYFDPNGNLVITGN